MGFFSIHNLIAPFRNKVHLVTICLIAALFGVFRLHGGGFSIERLDSNTIYSNSPTQLERDYRPADQAPTRRMQDILNQDREAQGDSNSRGGNTGAKGGLDEIERSLGLR